MAKEIRKQTRPDNITGIIRTEYAPADEVLAATATGESSKTLTMKTGGSFARIELRRATLTSTYENGAYRNSLKGTLADWTNLMSVPLRRMAGKKHILRITDAQGRTWGLGTPEEPLRMTYARTCGEDAASEQGTEIEFSNTSTEGTYMTTGS